MNKLVSTRQLAMVFIVGIVTLKFLYLPSLLAKEIGRDGYIYAAVMMALDFLVLLFFLIMNSRYPQLSFYEILKKTFGTFLAKVILFLFFCYFMIKCWSIFQSNFSYLNQNLYTSLSWTIFSIPLLIVVYYLSVFGVNSFVRIIEICLPIIVIGILVSLLSGALNADYSNLLPVCENGFFTNLPKIFKYSIWFGDYTICIIFFGNVKEEKKQNSKILLSCLITLLVVVFFLATSYAVFSYSSVCHTNSISDMLQILPSPNDIGNFDWIIVLVWDVAMFLNFSLNILAALYCFRQVFYNKHQKIVLAILLLAIFVASLLTRVDILTSINFLQSNVRYAFIVVQYVLPTFIFLFSFKLKKEDNKNAKILLEK